VNPVRGGWGDRVGVAIGFAALLAMSWYALGTQPAAVRSVWLDWASTDKVNLADHPAGALLVSPFVGGGDLGQWLALAAVGLVATGWVLGALRTAILVFGAHVVGTYLSEGILALRVVLHSAPRSSLLIPGVGTSYVVMPGSR
jgi:hypothetical protein